MNKIILISLPLVLTCGLFANTYTADHLDPTNIANDLFNQFEREGRLSDLTDAQEFEIKEILKTSAEEQIQKVSSGELSLSPNAPNYFLLDTIKAGINAVKNIASKITSTVINIGKLVFNGLKGVLGTVVNAGLSFLSIINDDFIKGVIGTAAGALGKAISGFGPLIADAAVAIPVIGPELAVAGNLVLPWVDKVLNKDNVEKAVSVIGGLADAFLITKDAIKSASSSATFAPRADDALLAISKGSSSDKATDAQKTDGAKKLTKVCHGLMKYLSTLKAAEYNKHSDKVKMAAAQCNHWAIKLNIQGEK